MSERERFEKHERIYLQEGMGEEGSTTWCQDKIGDDDPEYIQIEKYNELQSLCTSQAEGMEELKFYKEMHEGNMDSPVYLKAKLRKLERSIADAPIAHTIHFEYGSGSNEITAVFDEEAGISKEQVEDKYFALVEVKA